MYLIYRFVSVLRTQDIKKVFFLQFVQRTCQCQDLSFGTVNEIWSVSSNQLSAKDVDIKNPGIPLGKNVKIQVN